MASIRNCNKVFLLFREFDCGRVMVGLCSKKLFCTTRLPCERILRRGAFGSGEAIFPFLLSRWENDVESEPQAFAGMGPALGHEGRFAPPTVRLLYVRLLPSLVRTGNGAPGRADPARLATLGILTRLSSEQRPWLEVQQSSGHFLPNALHPHTAGRRHRSFWVDDTRQSLLPSTPGDRGLSVRAIGCAAATGA
jgi:hypothetical protein